MSLSPEETRAAKFHLEALAHAKDDEDILTHKEAIESMEREDTREELKQLRIEAVIEIFNQKLEAVGRPRREFAILFSSKSK